MLGLGAGVPPHALGQPEVALRARHLFAASTGVDLDRLMPVFAHAGIERRYSSVPLEWYERAHGWAERNALYLEHAVSLLEQAPPHPLFLPDLRPAAIDSIFLLST